MPPTSVRAMKSSMGSRRAYADPGLAALCEPSGRIELRAFALGLGKAPRAGIEHQTQYAGESQATDEAESNDHVASLGSTAPNLAPNTALRAA